MTRIGYGSVGTAFVVASVLAILVAVVVIVWEHFRTFRTMKRLDDMLEKAITRGFTEEDYDESLLSAVETKMARYLEASTVSARNLQTEKDKIKTLISDISHQTKTPIANIMLYAQLLSEQSLPQESEKYVEALEGQAEKLKFLIEALVKVSRLESGVLTMNPQPSFLAPMLEEAVEQFRPEADGKDISLTLESAEGDGVFDPKWTAEAVCNLLDNAIKYTPAGGTVKVQTHCYEMFCRIDVSDNGPGIPEEEQAKVFGRFYRSSANYQIKGLGIGLYLTRQIAEGQGGYVKISSGSGKGATFSIYLPRK